MAKSISESFKQLSSSIGKSIERKCIQCDDGDCNKCKHRQKPVDESEPPPPPKPMCMHFALIQDTGCTGFATIGCDWEINDGIHGSWPYFNNWAQYMIDNYSNGDGGSFSSIGCMGMPSTFVLRIYDTNPISPINNMNYVDGNCNIGRSVFNTLCNQHCYDASFSYNPNICFGIYLDIVEFGSIILFGDPVNDPVGFNGGLLNNLQQIYGSGVTCTTTYDPITKNVNVQLFGIYTDFPPTINYNCGLPVSIPFNEITCP